MPLYPGFCGGSYPMQSPVSDGERTINLYPNRIESPGAPSRDTLEPTPGQSLFQTMPELEPRAFGTAEGRLFAVYGAGLYEIFESSSPVLRGVVAADSYPATISYNGTSGRQLLITSGGNGYCFVLTSNAFTQVLTGVATMGGMINSRFLAFNILTGTVRMSGLNDGTTWDPTLFFNRSAGADPWQAMIVAPPEIWLIGEETGEVWYDSGAFPQPFAAIPGAFFKYGTPAPFSAGIFGDYITWLSGRKDGAGSIVSAKGYSPEKISHFAVDHALGVMQRDSSITDCELMTYEEEGHSFACFSFPSARSTWVVDSSMGMAWHERGVWNAAYGRYDVWGPRVHAYAFGKHLVGNRGSGAITEMNVTLGSELNDAPIRRLRIGPPLWANSRERLVVDRFALMAETGVGLTSGQGSDPQVMLRTSRDGKTWGSERQASLGEIGRYQKQVFWNRCGSSDKLWVPEVTITDPVPLRLSGAEIDGTGFQSTGKAA